MSKGRKFLIYGFVISLIFMFLISLGFFLSITSKAFFFSAGAAYILTTLNTFAGYKIINFGYKKGETASIKIILGGMLIRLFLMLIAVFLYLKFLEISDISFIFSIFSFYIYYLIIEILFLNFEKV